MKKLIFLSLALSSCFAANPPTVVVNSAGSVTLNGAPAGTVVDVVANNPNLPGLRAALLDAWIAHEKSINEKADASIAKATDAVQADAQKKISEAQAAMQKASAAQAAAEQQLAAVVGALRLADISKLSAEQKKIVAAAITSESDKRRAELAARKAELEKQLAELPK